MTKLATLFISLAVVSSSALAAIPSPTELAKALAGADKAVKVNPSPKSIEDEPGRNGWLPTIVTLESNTSLTDTPEWTKIGTTTYSYDSEGRVIESKTTIELYYTMTTTTRYTYNEYGQVATQVVESTGIYSYYIETAYTYDPICRDVATKVEVRQSPTDSFVTAYGITITRDDQGRIVSVMPKIGSDDDDFDDEGSISTIFNALTITYGTDGFPSKVTTADVDWRGNQAVLTDHTIYSNLKFDHFDGQLTSVLGLFIGNNRANSGTITEDGEVTTFTTSYDGTTYECSIVEPTEKLDVSIETFDNNGSTKQTLTETDLSSGLSESGISLMRYDRFGILIENKETEISKRGIETIDGWTKVDVTYDPSTGFPAMAVGSEWDSFKQTFEPTERHIYGAVAGIEDVAVDDLSGTAKPLRRGIFTLDGRAIPSGSALAPGLYIIDGRKTFVR